MNCAATLDYVHENGGWLVDVADHVGGPYRIQRFGSDDDLRPLKSDATPAVQLVGDYPELYCRGMILTTSVSKSTVKAA